MNVRIWGNDLHSLYTASARPPPPAAPSTFSGTYLSVSEPTPAPRNDCSSLRRPPNPVSGVPACCSPQRHSSPLVVRRDTVLPARRSRSDTLCRGTLLFGAFESSEVTANAAARGVATVGKAYMPRQAITCLSAED
jgi:hypothetical protein